MDWILLPRCAIRLAIVIRVFNFSVTVRINWFKQPRWTALSNIPRSISIQPSHWCNLPVPVSSLNLISGSLLVVLFLVLTSCSPPLSFLVFFFLLNYHQFPFPSPLLLCPFCLIFSIACCGLGESNYASGFTHQRPLKGTISLTSPQSNIHSFPLPYIFLAVILFLP